MLMKSDRDERCFKAPARSGHDTDLRMRTPRWLREFSEWRWAACVWLIAGALAFIALALWLIPTQLNVAAPSAEVTQALATCAPPRPTLFAASPAPPTPPAAVAQTADTATPPQPPVAPVPPMPPATVDAPAPTPPDFAANNADRGDRPGAVIAR